MFFLKIMVSSNRLIRANLYCIGSQIMISVLMILFDKVVKSNHFIDNF